MGTSEKNRKKTVESNRNGLSKKKHAESQRRKLKLRKRKLRLVMKRAQLYLNLVVPPSITNGVPTNCLEPNAKPTREILGAPFPIIFVCVDVEAFEHKQDEIMEIGLSTLNSQDVLGLDPGHNGTAWAEKIHSRHFRIREYAHRRNKVYVPSCPEDFDFGESEWIEKKEHARWMLKDCFTTPVSVSTNQVDPPATYKFVLVAHSAKSDINYLQKIGFNPSEYIFDIIDTAELGMYGGSNFNPLALLKLLRRYGIAMKHLHNAGNDAHYTLQLMLAMAVKNFKDKPSPEAWAKEKKERIKIAGEKAKTAAEAQAALEIEGWSTSENEDVLGSALPELPKKKIDTGDEEVKTGERPAKEVDSGEGEVKTGERPKKGINSGNQSGYGGGAKLGNQIVNAP